MSNPTFVDFHNHPTLKPYGQSYESGTNTGDAKSKACIWYKDRLDDIDKLKENTVGFSPYTQSDFTSLHNGGTRVVVVSLYPPEKQFFSLDVKISGKDKEKIENWITLFGKTRIANIRKADFNYWQDLQNEVGFLNILNNKTPANGNTQYKIVTSAAEIDINIPDTIYVLLSIEGAHVFCEGNDVNNAANWANLEKNVALMKNPAGWPARPFFITLAHHFYNGLVSHSESLPMLSKFISQKKGMEEPVEGDKYITTLGYKLIELLYSTSNGKRILIDVKHMAKKTRQEFYAYHAKNHPEIPLIYSHGGATGESQLYEKLINLDREDIETIVKSNGIMGLELDQRIMGFERNKNKFLTWLLSPWVWRTKKRKILAKPIWDNLKYIAEICKCLEPDPWKFICMGTDFDGIINPLNEYRTADTLPILRDALISHLDDYWNGSTPLIPKNTGGNSTEVIDRIMFGSAMEFIKKNF